MTQIDHGKPVLAQPLRRVMELKDVGRMKHELQQVLKSWGIETHPPRRSI